MIDKQKLLQWVEEEIDIFSGPYDDSETPENILMYKFRINGLHKLEMHIAAGNLDVESAKEIGCAECDGRGYFEYETGVVAEDIPYTKEMAKEPCDCALIAVMKKEVAHERSEASSASAART